MQKTGALRRLAVACIGTAVLALGACGTDRTTARSRAGEGTIRSVPQDLSQNLFFGTSLANKQLVLTFDDGPGPLLASGISITRELSKWLKNRPAPIRATFFVNGACIAATNLPSAGCADPVPEAALSLDQVIADGHLLANHTTTHRSLTGESSDPAVGSDQRVQELSETDGYIASKIPWNRFLFRPPYGDWSTDVYDTLQASAMSKYVGPIYWDIGGGPTDQSAAQTMAADWECWNLGYTTKQCGDRYLNEIRSVGRGIVLMHDPYGDVDNHRLTSGTGNTADMVKYIVPILESEGFTFKALYEVPDIAAALPSCHASCATCSGPAANQCTTCGPGEYLSGGTCTTCSTCGAGTYQSAACTANANTVCSACSTCSSGTYPSAACTPTSNTVCSACHAGCNVCSGPELDQCGSCPAGFFVSAGKCQACTVCPAGTHVVTACSGSTDATCAPCAEGTFAAAPNASTCASCGSCDDGNACTKDACSPTASCTHTPIEGCVATGASGSSSTPQVDAGATSSTQVGSSARAGGDSGCSAARVPRAPSPPPVVALVFLGLLRHVRRRPVGQRSARRG